MEKILTVEDVATILQVKPITVREMFRERRLRAFKMGKAWRTTESMLREDIELLAKGQRPPQIAEGAQPEATAAAPTPSQEPAPAAAPEPAPRKRAPRPTPVVSAVAEGESESAADDTQQLLF